MSAAAHCATRPHSRFDGVLERARSSDDIAVAGLVASFAIHLDITKSELLVVVVRIIAVFRDEGTDAFPAGKTVVG